MPGFEFRDASVVATHAVERFGHRPAVPEHALFSDAEWDELSTAAHLTARQSEIARLLCDGHTYKSIALHVGISINTVRMHMRTLFAKLRAHDRVSALIELVTIQRALNPPGEAVHSHM